METSKSSPLPDPVNSDTKEDDDVQVFYHVCCMNNWKEIFTDQIQKIIYSGLYEKMRAINLFIVTMGLDIKDIAPFVYRYGNKIRIREYTASDDEMFTLVHIHDYITDKTKLLYLHTKGVTRWQTTTYTIGTTRHDIPNLYRNIEDWRHFMEWYLIKEYKRCLDLLDTDNTVGVNYLTSPRHYSGNFWWARGDYYLKLPRDRSTPGVSSEVYIIASNYLKDVDDTKHHCITQSGLAGYGHYFHPYSPSNYTSALK
jgi:hypothetical protein